MCSGPHSHSRVAETQFARPALHELPERSSHIFPDDVPSMYCVSDGELKG
jgi:hypothetical protein